MQQPCHKLRQIIMLYFQYVTLGGAEIMVQLFIPPEGQLWARHWL